MDTRRLQEAIAPLQPDMKRQLCYREQIVKWNPYSAKNLALCYEFRTGGERRSLQVIPDACLDFLFRFDSRGLQAPAAVVSGVRTSPISLELEPDTVYFGFKPYSSKGMRNLACRWAELGEQRVALEDLTPCGQVLARLNQAGSFCERVRMVRDFALEYLTDENYQPDFVEFSELKLCKFMGNMKIESLADYTGYTGRYCRERFKNDLGISIKRYSNILRVQNAVRMLSREDAPELADMVFENGYFDQSHMNREFRLYIGESPTRYQRNILCPAAAV